MEKEYIGDNIYLNIHLPQQPPDRPSATQTIRKHCASLKSRIIQPSKIFTSQKREEILGYSPRLK